MVANLISGFSFIAFVILIPPFVWHVKCHNIPAVSLIIWLMYSNITGFINAIIWGGPDFYQVYDGRGYCDVAIKLKVGSSTGKLCAISALALQLLMILRANNPAFMNNKSTRKIITDLCICWITPIVIMATSYVVQAQRIGILRYDGCNGLYATTWVTIVLIVMWNVIWALIAMIFSVLTLLTYYRKRKDVKDLLKCTNSGLNIKRFARLLIFSILVTLTLLPLSLYYFVNDAKQLHQPFNWDMIHHPEWNMTQYFDVDPKNLYRKYIDIGLSVIAFLIFGLGTDAVNMYKIGLIHLKVNKIVEIKDPRDLGNTQTRSSTNQTSKSNFTFETGLSDPTIVDSVEMEFNKVMKEDGGDAITAAGSTAEGSPGSKDSGNNIFTVDLEKGTDISDYLNTEEVDSREEIDYIINMAEDDTQSINFNYNVSKK